MVVSDLNEGKNSFRRLAENLPGIVYRVLLEDDNRMIFFNDMVQTMTGYSHEDLKKGKICSIDPLILPEDKVIVISIVKDAIENNVPFEVEYRINNKSGELKWFFERGRPVRGDNGNPSYIDGVIFDITESKKAEQKLKESEEKFRLLFESIADPIHVIDADLKIMYLNPAFKRWLKSFSLDLNIVGKTPVEAWPFIGERVHDEYQKVFKTKKIHIKEDWAHINDTYTFTETRKIPILKSGNVVQVITIIRDFSDRKKAEQKLEESEKKFKLYYENAPMGYQSLDSNGNILDVNNAWINFFGYSKEEVIGKSFGDFIDSEYLEVFNTRFLNFKETGELVEADFEVMKKDGSHAIVLFNGNINYDENGNYKQSHCIFQDITEQKQIQIELRKSESLLKNAQELAHIGHWELNPSTMEVSGSDELFRIFGLTHDEVTLEKFAEVVHPEDREMDLFYIRRGLEKGESWDSEHRLISKDGTEKWVHALGEAIKDDDGKVSMLMGTVQDITERKKAEEKITELAKFPSENPNPVLRLTKEKIIYMNNEGEKIFNTNEGSEVPAVLQENLIKALETNKTISTEITLNNHIFSLDVTPISEEGYANVYGREITERKKVERELKESEEKFRLLFESIADPIHVIDADLKIIYMNPAFEKWLKSYNLYFDTIGKNPVEAWPHIGEEVNDEYKKVFETKQIHIKEDWTHVNDIDIFTEARKIPIIKSGKVIQIITIVRDFSDRKKAEQKLKESEERFKTLFEVAPASIIYSDLNANILMYNKQFLKLHGIKSPEMIRGTNVSKFFSKQDLPKLKNEIQKSIEGSAPGPIEYIMLKEDGTEFQAEASSSAVRDKNGIVVGLIGVAQDITNRKKAEVELKESEKKFRKQNVFLNNILESLTHPFYVINVKDYKIILANSTASSEGLEKGNYCYSLTHHSNKPCEAPCVCPLNEVKNTKKACVVEHTHYDKEGNEKIYEIYGYPILDENGNVVQMIEYALNITDRKIAQLELKESEEKFRTITEQSFMGITILQDGLFKYFNKQAVDIFGYSVEEIQNWKPYEFAKLIHPEDSDFVMEQTRKKQEGKIDVINRNTSRIIKKSGEIAWVDNYSKTINYRGRFADFVMTEDITDKIIADQQLKESEEKFRKQNVFLNNILESLTHPFYVINAKDYKIILANSTASSEGLEKGQYCYNLTHHNDRPCEAPCVCPLNEVKNTKKSCVVEHTHYDKEGDEKIYEIYGYPILDESGNVVQMIEYALNISDRKKAENSLRKIAHQWRTTFDAMSESVFLLDLERNILQCNKTTLDMFGKEKYEEIIGHSCCEIVHGTKEPAEWCPMMRMIENNYKEASIVQIGDRWHEIAVDPVINDEGTLIGAVHIITDITEKKEAEQELIKLSNLKSELLSRTSHELKTPLVSIKGFTDILLELHSEKLDDYVKKTLKQIKMGCNRLESLIHDILRTAELKSGTLELKKLKDNLSILIKMCVSEFEGMLVLRNHTINLEISDKLICSFESEQIYNVITNIISNAIKYTPYNGKIKVKSEIINDFIIISVEDNGIGFSKEEKSLIFKQFGKIERYGQGYDVISEGSGLGLYISKKIIEMHGGEIWVESEGRDKGSTFYFSLPIS